MKKLWALRRVFGILLAIGLAAGLFVTALLVFPLYAGAGIVILLLFIVANQPRVRKERERTKMLVDVAFQGTYAELSTPPSLVMSSSYGYPVFEVKFSSKAEMEAASALNETFKIEIDKIFKGHGPRRRPFKAEMAIFFTYDGHLDELRARYRNA